MSDLEEANLMVEGLRKISVACGQGSIANDQSGANTVQALTFCIQYLNLILDAFGESQVEYSVSTELECFTVISQQLGKVAETLS